MKLGNKSTLIFAGLVSVSTFGYTAYTLLGLGAPRTPIAIANPTTAGGGMGMMNPGPAGMANLGTNAKVSTASLVIDPFDAWDPKGHDPNQLENSMVSPIPAPSSNGQIVAPPPMTGVSPSGQSLRPMDPNQFQPLNAPSAQNMTPGALPAVEGGLGSPQSAHGTATPATPKVPKIVLRALIAFEATRAYLEVDGKPAKPFDVGDSPAEGFTVQQITNRSVLVSYQGKSVRLRVGQEFKTP